MIDGFNISHQKVAPKTGFFSSILPDSIINAGSSKQKPISSINNVARVSLVELKITYNEGNNKTKTLRYNTYNPDNCSHIMAKLSFLVQG